jgi:hypothetical protein
MRKLCLPVISSATVVVVLRNLEVMLLLLQCCGSGAGIRCFFTSISGIRDKFSVYGIRIRDELPYLFDYEDLGTGTPETTINKKS